MERRNKTKLTTHKNINTNKRKDKLYEYWSSKRLEFKKDKTVTLEELPELQESVEGIFRVFTLNVREVQHAENYTHNAILLGLPGVVRCWRCGQ